MVAFPAAAAAASAPSGAAITLAGTLSATGSSSVITSTTRTVTVPAGNSGVIRFADMENIGGSEGGLIVRKNSDAPQNVSENPEITFADTDTITLSFAGAMNVGEGAQVTLIDATNGSEIATYGDAILFRV